MRPRRLSLQGRRRFINAVIEVAGNNAREINPAIIELHVGEGRVPIAPDSDVELGDTDRDGNADLKVKFDRAAVQALIPEGATSVLVMARWLFSDGSRGFASAELRIKSDGDDDDDEENN